MSPIQETNQMNDSLGSYLRQSREGKNVSIEQVAYATRISLKMLRALEEDDHTALPAPTFVRGYLQAYAKYVRIDTQDLLLRYQHHLATAPDAKRGAIRSHYLYVRERYQEKRRLVLVIVLFATMLSVAGAYFFLKAQREKHKRLAKTAEQIQRGEELKPTSSSTSTSSTTAAAPKEPMKAGEAPTSEKTVAKASEKTPEPIVAPQPSPAADLTKVAEKAPEPPKPAPSPAPAAKTEEPKVTEAPPATAEVKAPIEKKNFQLMLKASEDVWFRYQVDEEEVKDLTLRSGKAMLLRADKVIKMFSGNLGALKATLNGEEIASLASLKGGKSAVLPASEASNYKLPLFPQFQSKPSATRPNPENNTQRQEPTIAPPVSENPTTPPAP